MQKIDIKTKYKLDDSYDLVYINYDDYLQNAKEIEEIVQVGNTDYLWENDNWIADSQWESINHVINELKKEYPNMPESDKDLIREYLETHDSSDPVKECLKNTPSQYFYYSLGISDVGMIEEGGEDDEIRVKRILKRLGIAHRDLTKTVMEVVVNSGYGGEVVVLFEDTIENLLRNDDIIEFGPKAELCIMDRIRGSGCSSLLGISLICQFDRRNLHSDKGASGYSFTYDVCGLTKGYMDGAIIRKKKKDEIIIPVKINKEVEEQMKRDREFEKKWKETGECSFGDIKYDRHGEKEYINNFPCGNRCLKCGQFWID